MALHASSLAAGKGIYFGLQGYPYTVSPYMPLFYLLAAGLERVGLPMLLCGRLLRLYTLDRYAIQAGTLLIASTANLLFWGTVGQVDMLGILFSLVAFYNYSKYRVDQQGRRLVWAGLFVLLAAFTKQTMLAAGATIFLLLAREQRRRAAQFAVAVASCGAFLALALNHFTGGHFFENTLWANLNPFSDMKLAQQIRYLAMAGGALAVVALAGLRASFRAGIHPFYIYLAAAAAVLAATGSKTGADLNYQLEIGIALGLCAGWTLHRLDFFPRCFRGDRGAVTLLQIPVLLHIVLNLGITGKLMLERLIEEPVRRQEYATLRPYLEASRGPVISVQP